MPVAAIGGAVAAIGIAGASAATAGLTIGTGLAIAGAVGASVSAVGAITGNKTLAIAGGALGAIGGIGALADSAGLFGSAAGSFADAGLPGSDAAAQAAANTYGSVSVDGGLAGGSWGNTDVLSMVSGQPAPENTTLAAPTNQFGQTIPQGDAEGLVTPGMPQRTPTGYFPGNDASAPAATPVTPGPRPTTPGPAPATPDQSIINANATTPGPYTATTDPTTGISTTSVKPGETAPVSPMPPPQEGSTWGNILKWVEAHPTLALGGVTAISSFISGAFNPKTPAETAALNAQAAKSQADVGLIQAQTGLLNWQQGNIQQPIPVATRTRTNTGGGLINSKATA